MGFGAVFVTPVFVIELAVPFPCFAVDVFPIGPARLAFSSLASGCLAAGFGGVCVRFTGLSIPALVVVFTLSLADDPAFVLDDAAGALIPVVFAVRFPVEGALEVIDFASTFAEMAGVFGESFLPAGFSRYSCFFDGC